MQPPPRVLRDRRARPRPEPGVFSCEPFPGWHDALRRHWPEYFVEMLFTGLVLLVAASALRWAAGTGGEMHGTVATGLPARALAGSACALLLALLIYSPCGRRSGTHLNPAITLAFFRLRKIGGWDTAFYIAAQCVGAIGGAALSRLGAPVALRLAAPPGAGLTGLAIVTELGLSALAMLVILLASNLLPLQRWTGWLYAVLVGLCVGIEPPLAGLGLNPAQALAACLAGDWDSAWYGLIAPVLGMQAAIEAFRAITGRRDTLCAKLAHNLSGRCIFHCQHPDQARARAIEVLNAELRRVPS